MSTLEEVAYARPGDQLSDLVQGREPFLACTEYVVIQKCDFRPVFDPNYVYLMDKAPLQGSTVRQRIDNMRTRCKEFVLARDKLRDLNIIVIPKLNDGKDLHVNITDMIKELNTNGVDGIWDTTMKIFFVFVESFMDQNPDPAKPVVFVPPTTINIDHLPEQRISRWYTQKFLHTSFPEEYFTQNLQPNEEAILTDGILSFKLAPGAFLFASGYNTRLLRNAVNEEPFLTTVRLRGLVHSLTDADVAQDLQNMQEIDRYIDVQEDALAEATAEFLDEVD